jgi:hypothetical protein
MVVPYCAPERREQCPLMANPSEPSLSLRAGSTAESDIGDLSRTRRDSLGLEQAWVLGVYPSCETAPI